MVKALRSRKQVAAWGTGASWKWYSNNTYTTLVGTGTGATASLTVSPATTTTYYLRIEGGSAPCTATINGPAAGVTVTVSQPSIAPVTLQASAGTICNGSNTTLTQTGGSLGSGQPGNGIQTIHTARWLVRAQVLQPAWRLAPRLPLPII